ncbi:UNVERIFIED_CONTAM: hypothetical protein FKN15_036006 [Acipenser sinensis]
MVVVLTRAARLPEFSGEVGFSLEDPDFQKFVSNSFELTTKIQSELQAVLKAHESCLARIQAGLRLYLDFLPMVQDYVEPAQRHLVDTLSHDTMDLLKQIQLQMLSLELPLVSYPEEEGDLSSLSFLERVKGNSERRIGSYILLQNFKSFVLLMLSLELPLVSYPEEEGDLSSLSFLERVKGNSERRIGSYILLQNFKSFVLLVYRALRSLQRQ